MSRSPEPTIDLTLACAVLARQRMHLVVQKATELGVRRIVPLLTDHSVPAGRRRARASPRLARAHRPGRQAVPPVVASPPARTGHARRVPRLAPVRGDRPAPVPRRPQRRRARCRPTAEANRPARRPRRRLLRRRAPAARQTRPPWVLGGRVLRAETAVLVGLTAVQMTWGDFQDASGMSPSPGTPGEGGVGVRGEARGTKNEKRPMQNEKRSILIISHFSLPVFDFSFNAFR